MNMQPGTCRERQRLCLRTGRCGCFGDFGNFGNAFLRSGAEDGSNLWILELRVDQMTVGGTDI